MHGISCFGVNHAIFGCSSLSQIKYFNFVCESFSDRSISGFAGYFRLSVVGMLSSISVWSKTQVCRWNFGDIYHTVGDRPITTSGLGGHITISGCRLSRKPLSLNSSLSIPQVCSWRTTHTGYIAFLIKRLGAFFYPKRNERAQNRIAVWRLIISHWRDANAITAPWRFFLVTVMVIKLG